MMTPKLLTIRGETRSMKDWSRQPGAVSYGRIVHRLLVLHWDDEAAVFTPVRPKAQQPRPRPARKAAAIAVVLRPIRRAANPLRPTWGGLRSYPIEALELLKRVV